MLSLYRAFHLWSFKHVSRYSLVSEWVCGEEDRRRRMGWTMTDKYQWFQYNDWYDNIDNIYKSLPRMPNEISVHASHWCLNYLLLTLFCARIVPEFASKTFNFHSKNHRLHKNAYRTDGSKCIASHRVIFLTI